MRKLTLLLAALALVGAACGGGQGGGGEGGGNSDLSGTVQIDGSSTVFPVSEAIAEEFQKENPGVQVTVGQSGTGGGFEKFCNGETDISDASRPIQDDEIAACDQNDIEPVLTEPPQGLQVAIDGLTVAVNSENDFVECLTVDQLATMFRPDSPVTNWSDVDADWPAESISFFAPGADSGTFDYFTEEIVGEGGAMRSGPEMQTSEDDNFLVQAIQGSTNAIGYFGYAYYSQNSEALKAVDIDGGAGCVTPTDETIASGEYTPLSRPIFIYPSVQALERPEVQAFVDFYLNTTNSIVGDVGYIVVPEENLEAARQAVAEATGG